MGGAGPSGRHGDDRGHGAGDGEPDYRFTLANERTFLAWIRTALALVAGAVAVLHLVPLDWGGAARLTVGLALTVLAVVITAYAPLRWLQVQRLMRRGLPLPLSALPLVTTVGVALVCGAVLVGNFWG
ncbi:YidH family protein [Nocardiopsis suaedae]|uniref:YidH family protein n=1 Tax=Nocardiopsis suaedae TaxID=3018444 RepID=UPI0038CDBF00